MIGLILLLGALAVSRDDLTVGGLVAFITLALLLVWPIEAMGYIIAGGQEAATAAQRVYEILDTPPAVADRPAALVPRQAAAQEAGHGARPAEHGANPGRLVFDDVTFSYPGSEELVLRGVSLELSPGETVALVGATGSGKTTLLQLIPRLADVTSGAIRLDGTDIATCRWRCCASGWAARSRTPRCSRRACGRTSASARQAPARRTIRAALAVAQADFVDRTCRGAWTPGSASRAWPCPAASGSGSRWPGPSSGRPQVLLLDDPLSALDVHTEAKVTRALGEVLSMSTALVVAHRPSTVLLADRVALLDARRDRRHRHAPRAAGHRAALPRPDERRARRRPRPQPGSPQRSAPMSQTTSQAPSQNAPQTPGQSATAAWRGIATEDAEEVSPGLSSFLRRRSRRLLLGPAAPAPGPGGQHPGPHRRHQRGDPGRALPGRPGRGPDPAAHQDPRRGAAGPHHRRVRRRGADPGGEHQGVHRQHRQARRKGRARPAAAAVRALPAAARRLPRALHLGPGDLPAGLRRRLHLRPVRGRPGHPGLRGVHDAAGRQRHAAAGLGAGTGDHGRVHPAAVAVGLVPPRVGAVLPPHQGDHRPGHRALRRDLRRHQGGPGVPQGRAQRGDLHRPQPGLRRRQPARRPAAGDLLPRRQPGRQPGHRRRAAVRRLPGDGPPDADRRAGHVPALPPAVLRPAGRPVAVLQQLPVGGRGAGEDLRGAGRAAVGGRARAPGGAARGGRRSQGRPDGGPGVGQVRLPLGHRAAADGPGHPGRADGRGGRRHRRGQDHRGPAAGPAV